MYLLLTRILVWLLLGTIVYSVFQRFYPSGTFVGRIVVVILLLVLALSFINPNEPAVASLWRFVSFPLKPLGASILLMGFASQRLKGGGIDKPGGYLVGWALGILLLASTPAVAYFLVRTPVAMIGNPEIASGQIVQDLRLASSIVPNAPASGTMLAYQQQTVSDVVGDSILPQIAFNPVDLAIPPYLLQNPQDIANRGLRIEDFVPSAETLQLTTRVWESYLNQTYFFLRGR